MIFRQVEGGSDFVLLASKQRKSSIHDSVFCLETKCRRQKAARRSPVETSMKSRKKFLDSNWKSYTVTAWPPKVYSILVAPVKYNSSFVGAECFTPSTYTVIQKRIYSKHHQLPRITFSIYICICIYQCCKHRLLIRELGFQGHNPSTTGFQFL